MLHPFPIQMRTLRSFSRRLKCVFAVRIQQRRPDNCYSQGHNYLQFPVSFQVDDHALVHPSDGSFRAGELPALKLHMGHDREPDDPQLSIGKTSESDIVS